jgi:hypothetical protein
LSPPAYLKFFYGNLLKTYENGSESTSQKSRRKPLFPIRLKVSIFHLAYKSQEKSRIHYKNKNIKPKSDFKNFKLEMAKTLKRQLSANPNMPGSMKNPIF